MSDCFETACSVNVSWSGRAVYECSFEDFSHAFIVLGIRLSRISRFFKLINLSKSSYWSIDFVVELWLVTEMKTSVRIQYVARLLHENTHTHVALRPCSYELAKATLSTS